MTRIMVRSPEGDVEDAYPLDGLPQALGNADFVWLDLDADQVELAQRLMLETFGFHRLAVDDALDESHLPRLDDWGEYAYVNLHAVELGSGDQVEVAVHELDLFIGHNYLVTHHADSIPALERVWTQAVQDDRLTKRGPAYVLYTLADGIVADLMPVVEHLDQVLDGVEDTIFDSPTDDILEEIFALKRALLELRRVLAPHRELFNRLYRGDSTVIPENGRVYFRDVYDHLVRLYELVEGLRDLASGALETYLSVVSNRMNEVVKTLTVITTIFMPISFLAGFFGMNFFAPGPEPPAWTAAPGLWIVLTLMVVSPGLMLLWMRRRGWM